MCIVFPKDRIHCFHQFSKRSVAVSKNDLFEYRDFGTKLGRRKQLNLGCSAMPLECVECVFRVWLPGGSVCVIQTKL